MDNYIKVYTTANKNISENDFVISAGRSEISEIDHKVKRKYEKNNFLIIYLKKGNMIVYNEDNSQKSYFEGSIIIFAPEKQQKYYFTHNPKTENYWVHFQCNNEILKELNIYTDSYTVFNIGLQEKIISQWDDLITEIQIANYASRIMANALFMQILTNISRIVYKKENPKNSSIFKQLTPAITSMYNDYTENKSNSYYASLCNMSESSFYHLFARTFKTTPNKYLNEIRLRSAENLLLETDYSLEKIAYITGFTTSQYFSKKFKEKHLISPLKYRNTKN